MKYKTSIFFLVPDIDAKYSLTFEVYLSTFDKYVYQVVVNT